LFERAVAFSFRDFCEEALELFPEIDLFPFAVARPAVNVRQFEGEKRGAVDNGERRLRLAVHELRAELDRHGKVVRMKGVDAAADAIARLEDDDAVTREITCGRESRGPGADDDDVVLHAYVRTGSLHIPSRSRWARTRDGSRGDEFSLPVPESRYPPVIRRARSSAASRTRARQRPAPERDSVNRRKRRSRTTEGGARPAPSRRSPPASPCRQGRAGDTTARVK